MDDPHACPSSPREPTHTRRYLPHFSSPGEVQFITFRLRDSLPRVGHLAYRPDARPGAKRVERRRAFQLIDDTLDAGLGSCSLARPEIATLVQETLQLFHGSRYDLICWTIMPNHVHVVIKQRTGFELDKVVHSWKSYTAKKANALLGRTGAFWQREYFDRYIRNARHLGDVVDYVERNPVKAGLCQRPEDWPFGSAAARERRDP